MAEYIEREKAKKAVKYIPWCDWVAVGNCLDDIPAADVEFVNHGWWIDRGEWVDCSECGTVGSPQWKRCPVCEARMDE